MSGITTHVLDTARGQPARGITVTLLRVDERGDATPVGVQLTDDDGRARALLGGGPLIAARYRLIFDTGAYLSAGGSDAFFPTVAVDFDVRDAAANYHVPLLLSPFGYATYRGS